MKTIFIEGVCGTGKTTLVNNLSKALPAFTIPELPEFSRGLLKPFSSSENIRYNFMSYIFYEKIREGIVNSKDAEKIEFVVFDRSYVSIIALLYSMLDILGIEYVKSSINLIIDLVKKK